MPTTLPLATERKKSAVSATYNNVVYWSGTMLDSDNTVAGQIQQVNPSGFTTVVLWCLHVSAEGNLSWNDTPIVAPPQNSNTPQFDPSGEFTKLAASLNTLLDGGTVQQVFFSIGSGGVSDFTHIYSLIQTPQGQQTLRSNFALLTAALPMVTGFDFDNEDWFETNAPVVWLTQALATASGATITYCPYSDEEFWNGCMEAVYQQMGSQPVAWWNLQCYSGGDGNVISEWVQGLSGSSGIPNPDTFIIPMYAAVGNNGGPGGGVVCPGDLCSMFAGYQGLVPGGGLWNTQHVFNNSTGGCGSTIPTIGEYAENITSGLNNNCS